MNIDENYFKTNNPMKQNKIEDILSEDEIILQRLLPNRKVFLLEALFKGLPFVLLWVAFDAFFIFMMIANNVLEQQPFMLWVMIGFFAFHLMPLWLYILNIIRTMAGAKNIEYVFTNRRIIIRSGVIGIDFKNIYYSDVEGINCKVGIFDRMFKVGDLYIKAHDQSAVLMNIEQPYFFLEKLQRITLDIKTDIEYPNDLRPKENHGYHTDYKG